MSHDIQMTIGRAVLITNSMVNIITVIIPTANQEMIFASLLFSLGITIMSSVDRVGESIIGTELIVMISLFYTFSRHKNTSMKRTSRSIKRLYRST